MRHFGKILVVGAIIVVGAVVVFRSRPDGGLPRLTVYKSPTCGCCAKWVGHVRRGGFKVKIVEMSDVKPMKDRLGVPGDLVSCHTAVVDGYVIEGHVPAEDIRRMLIERDAGAGLAVRGMPAGAPGMETANPRPYEVVAFDSQGARVREQVGRREVCSLQAPRQTPMQTPV
jgi:hypothetical protein